MNTQNSSSIFLAMLIVGFTSCKKEDSQYTTIKGRVIDINTNEGIQNQELVLYEKRQHLNYSYDGATPHYSNIVVKRIDADSNGYFDFGLVETKTSKNFEYQLGSGYNIVKGVPNNFLFYSHGHAYINLTLSTPPPYNTGDSLTVNFSSPTSPTYNEKFTDKKYRVNPTVISTASGAIYVNIDKYKSGAYTNIKDTLHFVNNYDRTTYNVTW